MEENKRILYVASTAEHLDRFHGDYISALEADGYQVKTLARGSRDLDIPFEKRIFSLKNFLLLPKIRRIIRRGGFGAIILNTSLAAFFVRLACKRKNRPKTVNIVHGYLFSEESKTPKAKMLLLAERFLGKKTDVILTMNAEDTRLAKKYRLTEGKIVQIPGMGAKLRPQITPPEEIRLLFSPDSYLLVFVGELSKRKNQKLLIEALHIIKKDIPSARLCLVGDGGEREALRNLAVRFGISDSVFFVGKRRDACDFIRAADLYVTASISEGLPFNVIEALGAGKTVVASRVKGHTDIVEDGASGFLFDVKNADTMAALVIKIHREGLRLDGKEIEKQYEKYKKENVFLKVYREIKNAIKA